MALDLRAWSLAGVVAWFDYFDCGKNEGRFTQLLSEDGTLCLELQMSDAAERKVMLTGVLRNRKHAARVIDVLFGVATEYLQKQEEVRDCNSDNKQLAEEHKQAQRDKAKQKQKQKREEVDGMSMFVHSPEVVQAAVGGESIPLHRNNWQPVEVDLAR